MLPALRHYLYISTGNRDSSCKLASRTVETTMDIFSLTEVCHAIVVGHCQVQVIHR